MKKLFLLLALVIVLTLVLCACGVKSEQTQNNESEQNTVVENNEEEQNVEAEDEEPEKIVDPSDFDKLVVRLNGAQARMNDLFVNIKDEFGTEAKPAQSYTPCGGSDDAQVTTHYYDGLEIEETADGIVYHAKISGFDYPDSTATVADIRLGDTPEKVRNTFGTTPDTDNEYTINYSFDTIYVSFGLDNEGTGNVNYISIDDFSLGGV